MSFSNTGRLVIKIGSSLLTHKGGRPNLRRIDSLSRVISELKNTGRQVVLVSSGAIAVGRNRLGMEIRPHEVKLKQAAAAVGQCDLMSHYDRAFSEYGYVAAQILMNRDIVNNPERKTNVINTFETLLEMGAVPIVNENDSVAIEELMFGDNDRLSAIVATLVHADKLIILTDIDGFYTCDPRKDQNAHLIERVEKITPEMMGGAGNTSSDVGTGGMKTKLEAAALAAKAGIPTIVMSGKDPTALYDVAEGKSVGTYFCAEEKE